MQISKTEKNIKNHYNAVFSDIEWLCAQKHIFNEYRNIVQNNSKINICHSFYAFINDTYSITLFMGIRRHVKHFKRFKAQSYSLINLLYELKGCFSMKGDQENLNAVGKDIEMIEMYSKKYEVIIDKRIPHLDKDVIGKSTLYNIYELEECVENLYKCTMHYFSIICPDCGYVGFHIPDGETWKDIFKVPWIEET